jgi:hypothetical protein
VVIGIGKLKSFTNLLLTWSLTFMINKPIKRFFFVVTNIYFMENSLCASPQFEVQLEGHSSIGFLLYSILPCQSSPDLISDSLSVVPFKVSMRGISSSISNHRRRILSMSYLVQFRGDTRDRTHNHQQLVSVLDN